MRIDVQHHRRHLGTFHPPKLALCPPETLAPRPLPRSPPPSVSPYGSGASGDLVGVGFYRICAFLPGFFLSVPGPPGSSVS